MIIPVARLATLMTAALLCPGCSAQVTTLHPQNWQQTVVGRDYLVYFTVQGCKHCERLAPMMDYVAESAPDLRVGRVDATAHNGLARTFGLTRYPTIARFDAQQIVYEYTGQRTPPQIIAFGRGDHRLGTAGNLAPSTLMENVPEWQLMLEALWPPLKMALSWALGIALGIKGLATGCLWVLQRGERRRAGRAREQDTQSSKSE